MSAAECNGCGRCCWPVALPYTQLHAQTGVGPNGAPVVGMDPADRRWILEDLTPITRRQGLGLVGDYMHGGVTEYGFMDNGGRRTVGETLLVWTFFYRCRHYDEDSRTCTAYEGRPPMCRDFPWYGAPPDAHKALPPECAYNADVGKPVAVTMGPSR